MERSGAAIHHPAQKGQNFHRCFQFLRDSERKKPSHILIVCERTNLTGQRSSFQNKLSLLGIPWSVRCGTLGSSRNVLNEPRFPSFSALGTISFTLFCTAISWKVLSISRSKQRPSEKFTATFNTKYRVANVWSNRNQLHEDVWFLTANPLERPTQLKPALRAPVVARQASHHSAW